jgi:hypothetical protein
VEDLKEAGRDIKEGVKDQYQNIKDKAADAVDSLKPQQNAMHKVYNWVFGSKQRASQKQHPEVAIRINETDHVMHSLHLDINIIEPHEHVDGNLNHDSENVTIDIVAHQKHAEIRKKPLFGFASTPYFQIKTLFFGIPESSYEVVVSDVLSEYHKISERKPNNVPLRAATHAQYN